MPPRALPFISAPVLVLLCSSTFWGLSWIPLKFFSAQGVAGISLIFAVHCVLLLLLSPWSLALVLRREAWLPRIGIACAGGMGIFSFTYAYMYGDVVRVMVLFYLLPVWGVLGGRLLLGERIDAWRWFGVALAIVGAYIILGGAHILASPPTWIDALALISGLSFALNNILFRGVRVMPLREKLWIMFLGVTVITGGALVLGMEAWPRSVSRSTWWWLLFYSLTGVLLANIASQWAIERLESGRSAIIITMQLVAAVGSAVYLGGTSLAPFEWLGAVMVVSAGLIEASRRNGERPYSTTR